MKPFLCVVIFAAASLFIADTASVVATAVSATDPHAYFNTLAARNDVVKSYSLRDENQLVTYKAAKSRPPAVNYDPAGDSDPRRQDAAKVVVPTFVDVNTLSANLTSTGTSVMLVAAAGTTYVQNAQLRIDDEIMTIVSDNNRGSYSLTVARGALGTTAKSHTAGVPVAVSNLSLQNQVWLPLGTKDGHTYLATWDAWFGGETGSVGLKNWKAFRFDAPRSATKTAPNAWYQINTHFALGSGRSLGVADSRATSPLGPNVTKQDPLSPQVGTFIISPERWTRYWVEIDQRANDWDLVSLWVADEEHDATQIVDRLEIENFGNTAVFRLEFNTSTYTVGANVKELVSYVRNFVMLQDVGNPQLLMQKPLGGAVKTLAAPTNLRVVN